MKRMTAIVAVMALGVIGPACARSEPCSGEADCPHMVSHGGRDYFVSCTVVPRRLAGDPIEVTQDAEEFGPGYGVTGFELQGADPAEAIVLKFEQKECGDEALHVGFAEDLPEPRLRELDRLLRR